MIIRSLMGGGAERVMSTMANYWVARGVSVSIITSVPRETDAYTLDERVKRIYLMPPSRSMGPFRHFPWKTSELRKAIAREGNKLVVSFMDRSNIPVILATRNMNVKVVVAERIDPRTQHYGVFQKAFMRMCYPRADAVTVLTENVKREWAERFIPPEKVHVIRNPVLPLNVETHEDLGWLPEKFICCMGRLHPQKGFDMLLDVLPRIFATHPDYELVILGDGESRHELETQAERLGIAGKVHMPGFNKNPHAIMQKASLFVFPSRFEGFPNALIEAMALGLPCISFDCPSGPSCLIEPGHNGVLIPPEDTQALKDAMFRLLGDPELAKELGERATAVQMYCHPDRVMGMWTSLLERVLESEGLSSMEPAFSTLYRMISKIG